LEESSANGNRELEYAVQFKGTIFIVIGGFLIGFGTKYAGRCTSGHSIMGLSNLKWPSLVAIILSLPGNSTRE